MLTAQERVAAAGGTVLNNSGLRVMGILQCTRAIGDKDLQPYGVIPMPDVLSIPRTGQEEFLVLATDGLWDVLSNQVGVLHRACFSQAGMHMDGLDWYSHVNSFASANYADSTAGDHCRPSFVKHIVCFSLFLIGFS